MAKDSVDWASFLGWKQEEINDLRFIAYTYIKQGIYEVALTFFEAITIISAPSAYDLQIIGALHLQVGNNSKALHFLDNALEIDPNALHVQLNRAKALFSLGRHQQGLEQAGKLKDAMDPEISKAASALILSYT